MNTTLQIILTMASGAFFIFILNMVRIKHLELKYALTWLLTGFGFIILSVYPDLLTIISGMLHIVEPVNTLFLLIMFFMILIIYTLTLALSRSSNRVKTLVQEVGIIKQELNELKKNHNKVL